MKHDRLPPIHPGEILVEEFMTPKGLNAHQLSLLTGLATTRVNDIVRGRRGITAETALKFAAFFKNSPEFWMNLQTQYDLEVARDKLLKAQ
jgi:addiction module HigA family antidote